MENTLKITIDQDSGEVILRRQDEKNSEVTLSTFSLRPPESWMLIESLVSDSNNSELTERVIKLLERMGLARPSHK